MRRGRNKTETMIWSYDVIVRLRRASKLLVGEGR